MSEPLRPLTLGEILDRTAQLYCRNFLLFAGVAAVPMSAMVVLIVLVGLLFAAMIPLTVRSGMSPSAATGLMVVVLVLVGLPLLLVMSIYSYGSLTYTAARVHLGERPKIKEALKSVTPHLGRYLWLVILQVFFVGGIPVAIAGFIAVVLGLLGKMAGVGVISGLLAFLMTLIGIAAIVVIVFRALEYSMSFATCVIEEKSAWISLQRAATLSKGTCGRIFVMFLLVMMLSMVLSMIGYIPLLIVVGISAAMGKAGTAAIAMLVVGEIVYVVMSFTAQTLLTPVYSIALVLFYYDQRVRKEGFDIEWMMMQAGLEAPLQPVDQQQSLAGESITTNTDFPRTESEAQS